MKKQTSFFKALQSDFRKKIKRLKRQKNIFKAKLFLTVILPFILILITAKTIECCVRLKLKDAAVSVKPPEIIPLKKEKISQEAASSEH